MKRRKSGWKVALFGLLILGGIELSSPEDGVLGGATEEETTFGNVTDTGQHPSLADSIAGQTVRAIKTTTSGNLTVQTETPESDEDKLQFIVKGVVVKICRLDEPSTAECPFCVDDQILKAHVLTMPSLERPRNVDEKTLRCPFPNESDNDECAKNYTTRLTSYVKINREESGKSPFFDNETTCIGNFRVPQTKFLCWGFRPFTFNHHVLGRVTSNGYQDDEECSDYCFGFLIPLVNTRYKAVKWEPRIKCPGTSLIPECVNHHLKTEDIISLTRNDFCFKKTPTEINEDNVIYGHKFIPVHRKCQHYRKCPAGYCVKERNQMTGCGSKPYITECLSETRNGSSWRLSKDLWCCTDPNGCKEPVGRCTDASDCLQKYCIGIRKGNRHETRCPKEAEGESGWKDCEDLSYGETRWIEEKSRWCCVPKSDGECDYFVRSCGSNLTCLASFCIGEKQGEVFGTRCPTEAERYYSQCEKLEEGNARMFQSERVCCKKRNCPGVDTFCGEDPGCNKDFCVALKGEKGSSELVTVCPTDVEEEFLSARCSVLKANETIVIENDGVWCCKSSRCELGNLTQYTTPTTTDHVDLAENLKVGGKFRPLKAKPWPTRFQLIFVVMILGNVVTFATCSVTVVCYRMLVFERKRARKLRKKPENSTSRLKFEGQVDALLEKILHSKRDDTTRENDPETESVSESDSSSWGKEDKNRSRPAAANSQGKKGESGEPLDETEYENKE